MAERPAKRTKLLSDSESDGSDNESVKLPQSSKKAHFKINDEYAKRFEHNNKRADLHRLEEKYGKGGAEEDSEEESSTDESEDDDADLVTADLDNEIFATLKAIKEKDPRVYDEKVKFYKEFDPDNVPREEKKKDKAMTLQDYHRQNLLAGYIGEDEEDKNVPQTYNQEQDALRRQVVGQMHALADGEEAGSDSEDDFKPKAKGAHDSVPAAKSKSSKAKKLSEQDIAAAEKDPETYLSNFMAAQAWRAPGGANPHAFDSDDSEDEARADAFEEAYNMRFEDPALANEKLQTFARDVGKYSVRRDEVSGRKAAREKERQRKEAERLEREEDRARLRKLKIEEAEEKVKKIKEAAGLRGKDVDIGQWRDVIEGDFDDDQWDKEMQRRFGEDYYAENEGAGGDDSDVEMGDAADGKKHKVKKPKWDDDIDIGDLVPEFEEEEARKYTLSSDDEEDGGAPVEPEDDDDSDAEQEGGKKRKTKKDRLKEKAEVKRASRKERRAIEEMVDSNLPLAHPALATGSSKAPVTGFRYRETSPTSFGLSARDILFADDSALNQFAGLKKMATWRDPERKAREAKKLSKKGRLRQWRKDTFGKPDAPEGGFEYVLGDAPAEAEPKKAKKDADGNVKEGERKKKRSKKRKAKEVEA